MSMPLAWRSEDPAQTLALGRALGELLQSGDLVALAGPLGAGKTQLVKGIAAGLGVPADEPVVSPTFVLVREYAGRLKLFHLDAYRLGGPDELLDLGLEEMIAEEEAVVVIEWADRIRDALPATAWWLELAHAGEQARTFSIHAFDAQRQARLARAVARLAGRPR